MHDRDTVRRLTRAVPAAVLAALSACTPSEATEAVHLERLPQLIAEADRRIGDFEDPSVGFSRISAVDVDRDGDVYVVEASVPEIRVYTPEGALLRRIGRRGAGPGEFERAPRFGILGDTVWAVESLANRLTLFDRQGTVLGTSRTDGVPVPLPSGFGWVLPGSMRLDGTFTGHLSRVSYRRDDDGSTGVEPTDSIPYPVVRFDPDGSVRDTIGWVGKPPPRLWRPPSEAPPPLESIQVGNQRLFVPRPPTTLPWWNPLPDGYLSVETPLPADAEDGVLRVSRIDLGGDTVYSRVMHYRPVRYSAADLDSIAARAARGDAGGMAPSVPGRPPPPDWRARARALRRAMDFPELRLPVQSPWFSRDGAVWLRLRGSEGPASQWVLLDPDGRPRGRLELPADIRIMWHRGDTFWAAEPDEFDVPWLVRYRIREGEG